MTIENRLDGFLGGISTFSNYVKLHSKEIGRAAVLTTALIAGMYTAGCNGNNSDPVEDAGPDGDTDTDSDTDSDSDTGYEGNPFEVQLGPAYVDTPDSNEDDSITPDETPDGDLGAGLTVPPIDEDYTGDVEGTIKVETPSGTYEIATESGLSEGDTLEGTLDLLTSCIDDLCGLQNGDTVKITYTLDAIDALGDDTTTEYEVELTAQGGVEIGDEWELIGYTWGGSFLMNFPVTGNSSNIDDMEYGVDVDETICSWFADGIDEADPRIRGPPEYDEGTLASDTGHFYDNPGDFGVVELELIAKDKETGRYHVKPVQFKFERYESQFTISNASRTCVVDATNETSDDIFTGLGSYVDTTNTDGSATGYTELNQAATPTDLATALSRLAALTPANHEENAHLNTYDNSGDQAWECVELIEAEGGIDYFRVDVGE